MIEYINGKITEISPAFVVIENEGIGYGLHVSLNTYTALKEGERAKLFIHQVIREDAHTSFGFFLKDEREIFRLLIGVNGIGPNTARMMLSSLSPAELRNAVINENAAILRGIKGIGAKTAQRIIIDLKDKMAKTDVSETFPGVENNTSREEALSALIMLGFSKPQVEKIINKILKAEPTLSIEDIVKKALKAL